MADPLHPQWTPIYAQLKAHAPWFYTSTNEQAYYEQIAAIAGHTRPSEFMAIATIVAENMLRSSYGYMRSPLEWAPQPSDFPFRDEPLYEQRLERFLTWHAQTFERYYQVHARLLQARAFVSEHADAIDLTPEQLQALCRTPDGAACMIGISELAQDLYVPLTLVWSSMRDSVRQLLEPVAI